MGVGYLVEEVKVVGDEDDGAGVQHAQDAPLENVPSHLRHATSTTTAITYPAAITRHGVKPACEAAVSRAVQVLCVLLPASRRRRGSRPAGTRRTPGTPASSPHTHRHTPSAEPSSEGTTTTLPAAAGCLLPYRSGQRHTLLLPACSSQHVPSAFATSVYAPRLVEETRRC